jgi:ankyrin repeat protein
LHIAAIQNDIGLVKELLADGADPNVFEEERGSPLHWAAEKGRIDVVKELLKHPDIDPNIRDKDGRTALSLAVSENKKEIVEVLLAHGANPSLSMLLHNPFSREINVKLRKAYLRNLSSAGWQAFESVSKVYSGDITEFYEQEARRTDTFQRRSLVDRGLQYQDGRAWGMAR